METKEIETERLYKAATDGAEACEECHGSGVVPNPMYMPTLGAGVVEPMPKVQRYRADGRRFVLNPAGTMPKKRIERAKKLLKLGLSPPMVGLLLYVDELPTVRQEP